jgi:hypothetical protein
MRHHLWGFLLAAAVGLGAPYLEVANACRLPVSEQCVWGKALIWVNVAATFFIIGVPLWALLVWFLKRRTHSD